MKKLLVLSVCVAWTILLSSNLLKAQETTRATPFITADELSKRLVISGDSVLLVNFWATWCKPCVAELPYIEQFAKANADKKIKVLLVSLDFKNSIDTRLKSFIQTKGIKSEVVVIDQTNADTWMPKIEKRWGGAIPISLLYTKDKKVFGNREFESYEDLNTWINAEVTIK